MSVFILLLQLKSCIAGKPGVMSVTDFFEENGTAYIVMNYLEGMTLKNYIKENGTMAVSLPESTYFKSGQTCNPDSRCVFGGLFFGFDKHCTSHRGCVAAVSNSIIWLAGAMNICTRLGYDDAEVFLN